MIQQLIQRLLAGQQRKLTAELHANRLLLGHLATRELLNRGPLNSLQEAEFQVFSQFGDDGIIQYLVHQLAPLPHTFIEFGVERYHEANTRFLLLNNNWKGLVIDGDDKNINHLKQENIYWRHDLTALCAFITRDNINQLFAQGGFAGEIGLLSIDIDGNDYWVWERINSVNPVIVVAEYNSVFGPELAVSVPYQADFVREKAHYSNLFWGASLAALCHLAQQKGYDFIGCNSAGNNAYFVRSNCNTIFKKLLPAEGYVESRFRESRNLQGELTFIGGTQRLNTIAHCQVVEVKSGSLESIENLINKK